METDYSFCQDNPEWELYLEEHGFTVIRGVVGQAEVETARDLFWREFEKNPGVLRADVKTWDRLKVAQHGIQFSGSLVHCEGAWYVRALPAVKSVFARIWKTDSLIVSMDSSILWKPWWINRQWMPKTEGLHLDQNPFAKPDKDCVQGMVVLYDVTPETGGLQVCPRTHTKESQAAIRRSYPWFDGAGSFLPLSPSDAMLAGAVLLQARAGDLLLWDSRTVHGGLVGSGRLRSTSTGECLDDSVCEGELLAVQPRDSIVELARLAQTVCMTPRAWASDEVQAIRRQGFQVGMGFNHCPHEANRGRLSARGYVPIVLTPEQLSLL